MSEFDKENITTLEVKTEHDIDTIRIYAQTEIVQIDTIKRYLDSEDNILRTTTGKRFIYRNIEESSGIENIVDYTLFFQKVNQFGFTKAGIKQAINFMESR